MSTNVTLHTGHDVAYFTSGQHRGRCAGAMSYYTAAGEPPGQWAGKGAATLGLSGQVDPDAIGRLYQHNIGPGGELLVKPRQSKPAAEREQAAVAAYQSAHPYASATELADVRVAERAKDPHQVPYFDLTISAVKSVSVLHASYRVSARQARQRGDQDQAAAFDARADEIEAALMDSAREAVAWLEQHASYTRTGHHSARTGEWRDGAGLTASLFLHHLSRDGDPQLHVHVAIWNRVQRADGADDKWRTLDSRSLHNQRLAVAPVADRFLETKLSALGYVMVPRADGNGAEIGGVGQDVKDLRGKDVLLLAGSNAEAADLARRVQAKLTQLGTVGPPQAALADGNHAGIGDLVRARLNTQIDASGRPLTNRDTLQITAFRGPDAEVRRQRLDGTWTGTFRVPRAYLAYNAELAYAGNVHVAQGRTVDTAHLLVTESLSRQALYVGMTRGRQANTAHVVTGNTAPPGHEPYQQATCESVLASIMGRDDGDLSATEQIRQAQDWSAGTGHLLTLWTAAVKQRLYPDIDQQIKATLTESEAWRYDREPSRQALQQQLRAAQFAGHDISTLIGQITAAPMDGARSIASVLHGRLQRLALPQVARHDLTWAQRTPASAPAVAHELAAALDARAGALGDQLAASPEPWLARHLGVLIPNASLALREEYARRAAAAAAYREAAGITDPQHAVSPSPHRGNPELESMRQSSIRALEICDEADIIRGLTRGELEARVLDADRAQATAPPEASAQLRLTAQAEADAWQQAADAVTRHDHIQAASSQALASQIGAERQQLQTVSDRYEEWSAATSGIRETAAKAKAELDRRGLTRKPAGQQQAEPGGSPLTMAGWWQQFESDLTAAERALERQRQAAIVAGNPRPPQRTPRPEQERRATSALEVKPGHQAARLDQLLGQAADAAKRLATKKTEQEASARHAARMEREAQTNPEPAFETQAQEQAEAEL